MLNPLKAVNLLLVLPDDRVLLKREVYKWGTSSSIPWSSTIETLIGNASTPIIEAYYILRTHFKVSVDLSPRNNTDVSVRTEEAIHSLTGKEIIPIIAKVNTHLSFQARIIEEFRAIPFEELLDEITKFSIAPKNGSFALHTPMCIHVARTLYERGILN